MAGLAEAADEDVVAAPRGRRCAARCRDPRARRASPRAPRVASPARTSRTMATWSKRSAVRGDELGQLGQQLARQVVDDRVAEVLEQLRGGGLAAARQAAEDDDRLVRPAARPARAVDRLRGPDRWLRSPTRAPDERARWPRRGRTSSPPRTNGLTRSPPGVATAAKMAMPRIDVAARARAAGREVRMPTRDRPTRRIGNSMTSPNARNIVVTKSKYGPAAMFATSWPSLKLSRNCSRERQDDEAIADAEREEERAPAGPRAGRSRRSDGVRPGAMNAQTW